MEKEDQRKTIKAARERQPLVEKGWRLGIKGMELMDEYALKQAIAKAEGTKPSRGRLNLK